MCERDGRARAEPPPTHTHTFTYIHTVLYTVAQPTTRRNIFVARAYCTHRSNA